MEQFGRGLSIDSIGKAHQKFSIKITVELRDASK